MKTAAKKLKMFAPWKESKPRQRIKKKRHHFANKIPYGQSYSFYAVRYKIILRALTT